MKYLVIVLIILCVFIAYSWRSQTQIAAIPAATPKPIPTPNPARGAMKAAMEFYPALARKGSDFNLMFIDLYKYTEQHDPNALAVPNWPLELAGQVGSKLNIRALPLDSPPAVQTSQNPFLGDFSNPLDQRPHP